MGTRVVGGDSQASGEVKKDGDPPVHQHTASAIQSVANEAIGGGEMSEQVFMLDIIHLDLQLREVCN